MNIYIIIISILTFQSCQNDNSIKKESTLEIDSSKFLIINIDSNKTASDETDTNLQKITGKAYAFSKDLGFDSSDCTFIYGCDCCVSEVAFINNSEFLKISYCMSDKTFIKGSFDVNDNKIILNYYKNGIWEKYEEWEEKEEFNYVIKTIVKSRTVYQKIKLKNTRDVLIPFLCNNTVAFKTESHSDLGIGRVLRSADYDSIIKWFSADSVKLKFNNLNV